jgi:acyl-CoA synthetase (AMP-forming)/AMP-acid ligase II
MSGSGLFSVHDIIFSGNQNPDHPAIESPGYTPFTYRKLRNQITDVVRALNGMGFDRHARIAVISPHCAETGVVCLAVMTGFTAIPLNTQYKHKEYEYIFSQFRVDAIIVHRHEITAAREAAGKKQIPVIELDPSRTAAGVFTLAPATSPAREPVFADSTDIAILLKTSGTTAIPKIVPLSHQLICTVVQRVCGTFRYTGEERCLQITPYYHTMGIFGDFLTPLCAGGTVICTRDFIASDIVSLINTCRPTFYSAGPAIHQMILRELKKMPAEKMKTNSLRFIRSASAPLPDPVREELERIFKVPVIEDYGTSETAGPISTNLPPRKGSVGIPVVEHFAIMDENGAILDRTRVGEIVVRGVEVFEGYENAPEENASSFTNGWFRTGDLGYLDGDGYLFITGRKKELINKGGEKIAPIEVDDVLIAHPLVKEAMSFRVMDPVLGEDIAAMVVRSGTQLTEKDLRSYLLDRLAPFKIPRKIYFVDAIPRNPTGKPLRRVGTERYSVFS